MNFSWKNWLAEYYPEIILHDLKTTEKSFFLKTYKNRAGVYDIIEQKSNRCYIGSSFNLAQRISNHLTFCRLTNANLKKDFQLLGKNFFVVVILEQLGTRFEISKNKLEFFENRALNHYPKNLLYNILSKAYSSHGFQHSLSTKKKLSLNRKSTLNPMWNREKSPEFQYYMTRDRKGFLNPRWGKGRPVIIKRTDGQIFKFPPYSQARKEFPFSQKIYSNYAENGRTYYPKT